MAISTKSKYADLRPDQKTRLEHLLSSWGWPLDGYSVPSRIWRKALENIMRNLP